MSEKITSTLDSRIAADVEARNRVQTQLQGCWTRRVTSSPPTT